MPSITSFGTVFTEVDRGGSSWSNLSNLGASDNSRASTSTAPKSNLVKITGFDFSAIPANAVPLAITVDLEGRQTGSTLRYDSVQLAIGGTGTGNDNGSTDISHQLGLAGVDNTVSLTDGLWGTGLTRAQALASDTGVLFGCAGGSNAAQIDAVSLTLEYGVPTLLSDSTYLGRWQLGQSLPLLLVTVNAAGVATLPDAAPYADIYIANTLAETVQIPITQPVRETGLFSMQRFLGGKYSEGSGFVVYRYLLSTVPYQKFAYFEILPGGLASGPAISLWEYQKPEARYIIQHRSNERVQFGRNPQLG